MKMEEYDKAYKLGKKEYQTRLLNGQLPTLEVLDEILPENANFAEVPLGVVQIPMRQIVGTKTAGRSTAFAANFMPILGNSTEFAAKWQNLSEIQENEGFRDPVKAYEYMNRFYIQEGNKRVSVMKYYGAYSIPGNVIRLIPRRTDELENKIYYEFLDFYRVTGINYIYFSKLGSFVKLQAAVGKSPEDVWTNEEKLTFNSVFFSFEDGFIQNGGDKLALTEGDAFLLFLDLYSYDSIKDKTRSEIMAMVTSCWEEFVLQSKPYQEEIDLKLNPSQHEKPLLDRLLPLNTTQHLKVAFIYMRTPQSSAWSYAHELGRTHISAVFESEIDTFTYENATQENIDEVLEDAIQKGADIIFTTSPVFVQASVKAAIAHPEVKILNCSLNTTHRYIRTYYSRMHEAKFLMGAIAGALSKNDKIAYIADYPIYGTIASINAFALGAKMVNPRIKVHLLWSTLKDFNLEEELLRLHPDCMLGRDMVIPEKGYRDFGLIQMDEEGNTISQAMPLYNWGTFYEKLIRTVMDGTWKYDEDKKESKAINYWWGLSADVVDVVYSTRIPIGTKRLVELLKDAIRSGHFDVFSGVMYSQNGIVQSEPHRTLTPEEIVNMDWLAENVIGSIPTTSELLEHAVPVTIQQGVETRKEAETAGKETST